jgi:DNA recombination protein Rad52
MSFTEQAKQALAAKLPASAVKTREQGGRKVSYIEGWHVIAEANRVFGFDAWTRETIDLRCVSEKEREIGQAKHPGWGVTYICKVRIIVEGVAREGCGAGHGIDRDLGQAHESALKEAETDAMKRAFMTFGNPFGLALYDKQQANVSDESDENRQRFITETKAKIAEFINAGELADWWKSSEQMQARRFFDLNAMEVDELKSMTIERINALTPKKAA